MTSSLVGSEMCIRDRGYRCLLIMAHRVQRGTQSLFIPWVAPLKEKSDAPKEILRTIDLIPNLGPLR
eukprot:4671883-Prorocentrum_lima.AAC.1